MNSRPMNENELAQFLAAQAAEIQSPENHWFAGESLGHEPSRQEAGMHYIQHGGAEGFRRRWERSHPSTQS